MKLCHVSMGLPAPLTPKRDGGAKVRVLVVTISPHFRTQLRTKMLRWHQVGNKRR